MKYIGKGKVIKIKGKSVGVVTKDGKFLTFRRESHKFRMYNGWGFNRLLIEELHRTGTIIVEIRTEKRILRTTTNTILYKGIRYMFKDEPQLILPEKYFIIYEK